MKIGDIRKKAKEMGLKASSSKKVDLIRAIQVAEGNPACFLTGRKVCDQIDCCWREDCLLQ